MVQKALPSTIATRFIVLSVYGFWLVFVPYATRAVFCSMDETLNVQLPPWFVISNSALKGNSLKKILTYYWNLIKLYSTQNRCGHVCVPYTVLLAVSLRLLSWDSLPITAYVPPNWSIKWKDFGSRQVCCRATIKQCPICDTLVPYAMVRLCSLYTEQSINYFGQKLTSFFKFYKFQPLKFFFWDFSLSANSV